MIKKQTLPWILCTYEWTKPSTNMWDNPKKRPNLGLILQIVVLISNYCYLASSSEQSHVKQQRTKQRDVIYITLTRTTSFAHLLIFDPCFAKLTSQKRCWPFKTCVSKCWPVARLMKRERKTTNRKTRKAKERESKIKEISVVNLFI